MGGMENNQVGGGQARALHKVNLRRTWAAGPMGVWGKNVLAQQRQGPAVGVLKKVKEGGAADWAKGQKAGSDEGKATSGIAQSPSRAN